MKKYYPDRWVILKITLPNETFYKVLGSWFGGYLHGNSWRMNSGIVAIEREGDYYHFVGDSGSQYICHKNTYGTHMLSSGVINDIIAGAQDAGHEVELLNDQENFTAILSD